MSSTLLEQTRAHHEEIEKLERLIARDWLTNESQSHKDKLYQGHRVKGFLEAIASTSAKLVEIYEDVDGARKEEIAALGGLQAENQNVFSAYYDRMKEIRDYHRRHPSARTVEQEDLDARIKAEPHVYFTGEEALGRFLDLHELHASFINSKFGPRDGDEEEREYMRYLDTFHQVENIPRHFKSSKQYRDYLSSLLAYLRSFYERTEPLKDVTQLLSKVETEFQNQWAAGSVSGWEGASEAGPKASENVLDVEAYDSVEELLEVGTERIKETLEHYGLKVGGTPEQRAARLLLLKDTPLEELDAKHFAKGRRPPKKGAQANGEGDAGRSKAAYETALQEAQVRKFCELLKQVISDTRGHVEMKYAQTAEEQDKDLEERDASGGEESDEDDEQIYNPLKLPMGPDGKPIPYWLYKLHGLNQEFRCEICGDASYWGRRAYERHFREWQHQHGMKVLGIPNTKQFNEITVIADALALHKAMQEKSGTAVWKPDVEEEYEDSQGNVYNKKEYTDLQRQGLI
eukprot:TRINITY_DN17896_c0_g1_i1.p2 TRINITY_DN17896_c0_g1~~TRINITY_DN17896_c0_g1_i1.p2  ORF type:complete len:517 (+),score=201.30 TRINITY_DN17896_c0_g1_i1:191-1741(+)